MQEPGGKRWAQEGWAWGVAITSFLSEDHPFQAHSGHIHRCPGPQGPLARRTRVRRATVAGGV